MKPHQSARFLALVSALLAVSLANPLEAIKRRAFATSLTGTGEIGNWPGADGTTGVEAANNVCQGRAAAAGLSNPGSFRAWLSDGGTDAFCNVQGLTGERATACGGQSLPIQGPWFLPDGSSFAAGLEELTAVRAELYRPILVDEFGVLLLDDTLLWTGTSPSGERYGPDCENWTANDSGEVGLVGSVHATAGSWTALGSVACSEAARLLCFESLLGEEPILPDAPGALVFVTSAFGSGDLGSWSQATGSGIEAGDAICRTVAADAGVPAPDSFVAWLSDADTDAADRVTVDGPFRRLDGFAIAHSRVDLLDGITLNSLHVDELGRYATGDSRVWTGSDGFGQGFGTNCSGWQSTGSVGMTGRSSFARSENWTAYSAIACAGDARLYCISNVVTIFWDGFETGDNGEWETIAP